MGREVCHDASLTYQGAVIDDSGTICTNRSAYDGQARYTITLDTVASESFILKATPTVNSSCAGNGFTLTSDETLTEL